MKPLNDITNPSHDLNVCLTLCTHFDADVVICLLVCMSSVCICMVYEVDSNTGKTFLERVRLNYLVTMLENCYEASAVTVDLVTQTGFFSMCV